MVKLFAYAVLFLLRIVRIAFVLLIILVLFGLLVPFIGDINQFAYLKPIINFEAGLNHFVKTHIPTEVGGKDASRIITLIALIILNGISRNLSGSVMVLIQKANLESHIKRLQKTYKSPTEHENIAKLESKMEEVQSAKGKNRQELLKEFIDLKRELEKSGRDLAFLSIDVVNSTGMKQGEDFTVVEHDFTEYHNFVESKFKKHGFIKASWTPDGVMACFNNIEDAVEAAQAILTGLDYFNSQIKVMKVPFQIRCGINAGFVYYDESIPLEQLSDRIIDIAGHMQKNAPPNGILIAKQIIEPVKFHEYFTPTERLIDGLEVCEWDRSKIKNVST